MDMSRNFLMEGVVKHCSERFGAQGIPGCGTLGTRWGLDGLGELFQPSGFSDSRLKHHKRDIIKENPN